jgi:hypothetical protein
VRTATLLVVLFLARLAAAQSPGTCERGRAEAALDVSDVYALAFTTGSLFYGNGSAAAHVVPKFSGRSPYYAAGLWVGGYVGGELRVAGATFYDFEFWPGPLDPATGRPVDPDDCAAYDRIWTVSVRDVEQYEATGTATPDLADWPVALGAEVIDGDGTPGNYDLAAGDRPRLYGSQTAFWVMNDVGNHHAYSETPPIGLEVRVHAFVVVSADDALNQAVVYRYTLLNRGGQPLTAARMGIWTDPDLGDAGDDYVGVDTARGLGYTYNSDDTDGTGQPPTYGTAPPASGFDLLSDGLGAFVYGANVGAGDPTADPQNGPEMYNVMRGLWRDGTPMTEGSGGPATTFAFSGDPVTNSFWSMPCPNQPCGAPLNGGNIRFTIASEDFTLAPGAARTFDVALLTAFGADRLDSITRLRAASDLVQQAYDAGTLFDAAPTATLPAATLLYPSHGQNVFGALPVTLAWEAVPGAEGYVVEAWSADHPAGRRAYLTTGTSVAAAGCGTPNHLTTCAWRVRADAPSAGAAGLYSETRTFHAQQFVAGLLDDGGGIVEVASPAGPVCPDPGDFGCEAYGGEGNTVLRDPGAADDYYVDADASSTFYPSVAAALMGNAFGPTASPDDYEIRFTAAGGYAVYNAFLGDSLLRRITRVPFEVWNVGTTPADPSDDLRMIPVLRRNTTTGPYLAEWADRFTSRQTGLTPTDTVWVTEQVGAFFPDRQNGYALFEQAAISFGGAGAIYDRATDGDTQIDLTPGTTTPCSRQGYYIAFCARNDRRPPGSPTSLSAGFVQLVFADLADDGTTPTTGTVVRLKMARYAPVANEPGTPDVAPALAVEAVRPNPVAGVAAVRYVLLAAGRVRVAVYDVLGRAVAVVADGPAGAGRHAATLDVAGLAPGVYVVAVETAAGRAARTFTVLR